MRVLEGLERLADVIQELSVAAPIAISAGKRAAAEVIKAKVDALYGDDSKLTPIASYTAAMRDDGGEGGPLYIDGALLKSSVGIEHPDQETAIIGSDEIIHLYHEFGYFNAQTNSPVPPRPVFHIAAAESESIVGAMMTEGIEAIFASVIGG